MILSELVEGESHPVYRQLEIENGTRLYNFIGSIVATSLGVNRPFLSTTVIKSFNFHAITCLHVHAGEFRPCAVEVATLLPDGTREVNHRAPDHHRVQALMDDFVNWVNRYWEATDAMVLASFVLWRLNFIHPFINGNGRSARAASYFVLCLKAGGLLAGKTILPELLRVNRGEYVLALRQVDESYAAGALDLTPLHTLMQRLFDEQMASAPAPPDPPAP